MSAFRILLFIIFVGSCQLNFANHSKLNKNVSNTIVSYLETGFHNKFCSVIETVDFSLESSLPIILSNPSDLSYNDFSSKYLFLCQHKNKIALLYISGNIVSLKFNSYNISSPFHYFP